MSSGLMMNSSIYLAKRFAKAKGFSGGIGGWIYSDATGRNIAHGWRKFAHLYRNEIRSWGLVNARILGAELAADASIEAIAEALWAKRVKTRR